MAATVHRLFTISMSVLAALTFVVAAISLVVLHRADGYEVSINPHQVTSLRAPIGVTSKLVSGQTQCIVGLTDGKFVSVVEPCDLVKQLLERERCHDRSGPTALGGGDRVSDDGRGAP